MTLIVDNQVNGGSSNNYRSVVLSVSEVSGQQTVPKMPMLQQKKMFHSGVVIVQHNFAECQR